MPKPAPDATFSWVVQPADGILEGVVYTDGSLLDNHRSLAGFCKRLGWAFVAMDNQGAILASAHGRVPDWVDTIYGAELWAMQMATSMAMPGSTFVTDCQSVLTSWQRGRKWVTTGCQRYARVWCPIMAALDDSASEQRVKWMPAHTAVHDVGNKERSDGLKLTAVDREANGEADRLAKLAASADRVVFSMRKRIDDTANKVEAIARWVGQATTLANSYSMPDGTVHRDCAPRPHAARRGATTSACVPKVAQPADTGPTRFTTPQLAAVLERVRQREGAAPSSDGGRDCGGRSAGTTRTVAARVEWSSAAAPVSRERPKSRSAAVSPLHRRYAWRDCPKAPQVERTCRHERMTSMTSASLDGTPADSRRGATRFAGRCAEGHAAIPCRVDSPPAAAAALQELQQLHESGLRVSWPKACGPRFSGAMQTSALPTAMPVQGSTAMARHDDTGVSVSHARASPSDEVLQDLLLLYQSGIPVIWPDGFGPKDAHGRGPPAGGVGDGSSGSSGSGEVDL